tara:strand:- start:118 stop:690 length:573 start_codon:yes stop_codon:yes gene_type:complete
MINTKEIVTLGFAAFFVLLILLIVFASNNKKLKNLAKQNNQDQKLVNKQYPFLFIFYISIYSFLIVDFPGLVEPYGLNGLNILIIVLPFIAVFLWRVNKIFIKKAKQMEIAGHDHRDEKIKLIKRFYPRTLGISYAIGGGLAGLFGISYSELGGVGIAFLLAFLVVTPVDNWLLQKLYEKAKLKEQALTK